MFPVVHEAKPRTPFPKSGTCQTLQNFTSPTKIIKKVVHVTYKLMAFFANKEFGDQPKCG